MRIIVTGGAGFIGSHICGEALARGHEVVAFDNLTSGRRENVPSGVRLVEADIRDREALHRCFSNFKPDAICHQAAQASVSVSMRDPRLDAEVNIMGSIHVLDACVEHGTQHFVFASTGGAIYGEVPAEGRASEDAPANPVSPYAMSKLYVEQVLAVYELTHGLSCTRLRYANVYGPRQDPHGEAGVVAIFFDRTLAGLALAVNARRKQGDEGCIRDYVFVRDVARANVVALEGQLGQPVLNVGSGVETTTQRLAQLVVNATGASVPLQGAEPRIGDIERSVLDPSLFVGIFGPPTELEAGLAETYAWYSGH